MATPPVAFRIREYDEEPSSSDETTTTLRPRREYVVAGGSSGSRSGSKRHVILQTSTATPSSRFSLGEGHSVLEWLSSLLKAPAAVAKDLFLPIGYPRTVKAGYLEYQFYDSLQGLCSYLRGVLCSAQVLQASGVGNQDATAWAAALTWALKDGMGMIGGLAFSFVACPLFDAYTKEFRLFADVINDVGLTLDMVAPYSPSLLLVSSASTLCKTLCGMSAAATKASITCYFAISGNMADLNAKESTQETLVSLIGMTLGVILASRLQELEQAASDGDDETNQTFMLTVQWIVFVFLTAVHVWANWKGVLLLHLPTLNRERAKHVILGGVLMPLLSSFGKTEAAPLLESDSKTTGKERRSGDDDVSPLQLLDRLQSFIPAPDQVKESLLASTVDMLLPDRRLNLGARLVQDILDEQEDDDDALAWMLQHQFGKDKYLLHVNRQGVVQVCLLRGATTTDELQAYCHAHLVLLQLLSSTSVSSLDQRRQAIAQSGALLKPLFPKEPQQQQEASAATTSADACRDLVQVLQQKGWNLDEGQLYLGFSRRRTEWSTTIVGTDDLATGTNKKEN